ncbi:hypothetical protein [Spirosoma sp. KNUC1025]|uniref:hypothetical protein n=1 Tax=Spirosoma sp. KNUC1025 TaxID=2894082 RepID=UPI00386D66D0|nr:hypothetical protein LN737_00080 [Spirosoma sp. KNUC1025]
MESILDAFKHTEWHIKQWQVKFLLSEKLLHQVKKQSKISNWYEDQGVTEKWIERLSICFDSINKFHNSFGTLPQVGDRLYDEDTGMIVQDRSIDGNLMTITYTLGS